MTVDNIQINVFLFNSNDDTVMPIIKLNIDGHMPFGSTGYPHAREPKTFLDHYLWIIIAIFAVVIILLCVVFISRKRKYKK